MEVIADEQTANEGFSVVAWHSSGLVYRDGKQVCPERLIKAPGCSNFIPIEKYASITLRLDCDNGRLLLYFSGSFVGELCDDQGVSILRPIFSRCPEGFKPVFYPAASVHCPQIICLRETGFVGSVVLPPTMMVTHAASTTLGHLSAQLIKGQDMDTSELSLLKWMSSPLLIGGFDPSVQAALSTADVTTAPVKSRAAPPQLVGILEGAPAVSDMYTAYTFDLKIHSASLGLHKSFVAGTTISARAAVVDLITKKSILVVYTRAVPVTRFPFWDWSGEKLDVTLPDKVSLGFDFTIAAIEPSDDPRWEHEDDSPSCVRVPQKEGKNERGGSATFNNFKVLAHCRIPCEEVLPRRRKEKTQVDELEGFRVSLQRESETGVSGVLCSDVFVSREPGLASDCHPVWKERKTSEQGEAGLSLLLPPSPPMIAQGGSEGEFTDTTSLVCAMAKATSVEQGSCFRPLFDWFDTINPINPMLKKNYERLGIYHFPQVELPYVACMVKHLDLGFEIYEAHDMLSNGAVPSPPSAALISMWDKVQKQRDFLRRKRQEYKQKTYVSPDFPSSESATTLGSTSDPHTQAAAAADAGVGGTESADGEESPAPDSAPPTAISTLRASLLSDTIVWHAQTPVCRSNYTSRPGTYCSVQSIGVDEREDYIYVKIASIGEASIQTESTSSKLWVDAIELTQVTWIPDEVPGEEESVQGCLRFDACTLSRMTEVYCYA